MIEHVLSRSGSARGRRRSGHGVAFWVAGLGLSLVLVAACGGSRFISMPPDAMVLQESDLPSPVYKLVGKGPVDPPVTAGEGSTAYQVTYAGGDKTVQSQVTVLGSADGAKKLVGTLAGDLMRENEYVRDYSEPLGDFIIALRKPGDDGDTSAVIFSEANVVGVLVVTGPFVTANEARAWAALMLQHME